ncbi:MAG: ATP-dependent Clp protease proteolytic subunit [Gammaproteobacteria bacterium]|nr:MAG: ATP-dependent Clp protease proteolytic subunit [Gammaproteobacteria bacterium]
MIKASDFSLVAHSHHDLRYTILQMQAVDLWRIDMRSMDAEGEIKEVAKNFNLLESALISNRTITLFGEINQEVARKTAEKLLALSFESDEPITMYIGSPGGHVESGDTIFDMIRYIKPQVRTVGTGWVGSIATHIYLAPDKENRFALPNTRFLIHQPHGGFGGDASDIEIHAREIVKTRERINGVIAAQTGQSLDRVAEDTQRDYWMSAEESVDYGLVGKIISNIDDLS